LLWVPAALGAPKILFALGVRPKTEPQAIQMQKKRQQILNIKKSKKMERKGCQKGGGGAKMYQHAPER
jgi:hypothetical protein